MITSVQNPIVKSLSKLQTKKYRDQANAFLVEGEHLVIEAQKANCLNEVYVTKPHPLFKDATLLSEHVMKKITQATSVPNIIGVCTKKIPNKISQRVLFLERIQDPGNVGTLLRSALAFGFTTIVTDRCADLTQPKVMRATQGALFKLNHLEMTLSDFIQKAPHHHLYATAVHQKNATPKLNPTPPFTLILGNEGQGLSESTLQLAHTILTINTENIESLNVATAGTLLMYALSGQSITAVNNHK